MLGKRARSHQKNQQNMVHPLIPDSSSNSEQKHKTNSFFNLPGLFVGLNPKASESDSVQSPTSPLDFNVFSKPHLGNSLFWSSKPQNSWDSNKVGLRIVESLDDTTKPSLGQILRSSDSKNVLFAPQMNISKPPSSKNAGFDSLKSSSNSLPENYTMFPHTNPRTINLQEHESFAKFCSNSLDSNGQILGIDLVGSLSASEIELSEDYTCVRKHGPNPKTTHIFGDRVLDRHDDMFFVKSVKYESQETAVPAWYTSDDFLSFCYTCKKKLEGEDIYIFGGEKAFCSLDCRSEEILIDQEMEKTNNKEDSSSSTSTSTSGTELKAKENDCEDIFETSVFMAT